MEPARSHPSTLVDLLDRVLDRGVVINADIIISVAGIPLIGVNLRAALAGMETMTRYGIMREWDESIRASALRDGERRRAPALCQEVTLEDGGGMAIEAVSVACL